MSVLLIVGILIACVLLFLIFASQSCFHVFVSEWDYYIPKDYGITPNLFIPSHRPLECRHDASYIKIKSTCKYCRISKYETRLLKYERSKYFYPGKLIKTEWAMDIPGKQQYK